MRHRENLHALSSSKHHHENRSLPQLKEQASPAVSQPLSQGALWHQEAGTQNIFKESEEAERQEEMSTACSFSWFLKWAAAPAQLQQRPKSLFLSQTAPSHRNPGSWVTSGSLEHLPDNMLALARRQLSSS